VEANIESVTLYEYGAKNLLGEFMEDLGHRKEKLRDLQLELKRLCKKMAAGDAL